MIGPALYPKGKDPRAIVELNKRSEAWINHALAPTVQA
jgi:1-acyl-sn-glycerol-3-phosphate acyltransferase